MLTHTLKIGILTIHQQHQLRSLEETARIARTPSVTNIIGEFLPSAFHITPVTARYVRPQRPE